MQYEGFEPRWARLSISNKELWMNSSCLPVISAIERSQRGVVSSSPKGRPELGQQSPAIASSYAPIAAGYLCDVFSPLFRRRLDWTEGDIGESLFPMRCMGGK